MEGMFNIQPSAAACQEMEPSLLLLLKQLSVFIPTYFIQHIFKTPSYVNLFFVPKMFSLIPHEAKKEERPCSEVLPAAPLLPLLDVEESRGGGGVQVRILTSHWSIYLNTAL